MAPFFRQSIDQQRFNGSRSTLDSHRAQFRQNQISGVFEIQSMPQEVEVLVFGGGEETGAYRLWPSSHLKITPSEIGIGWDRQEVAIRSVALPDQASRALWQALEYQTFSKKEIAGVDQFKVFLKSCFSEGMTGMVSIASELCDGFIFLHGGLPAPGESIFCSPEGFTKSLQEAEGFLNSTGQLTIYKADPATQAYQCTLLRMSMAGWGKRILTNYKDMVGQKLLHIMNANLNAILLHRQSNIHLADIEIIDNHFFHECRMAAQAYQTLFTDMAQLIGRVIGGMVTRRIMSTTFHQLAMSEQEVLATNTLSPSAFLR